MGGKTAKIPGLSQALRFLRVLRLLLWSNWLMYWERRCVIYAHEKGNDEMQPDVVKHLVAFRHTAIKLEAVMIMFGQFLSSRADLLPEQALAVLASLQDEVSGEPFSHVVTSSKRNWGNP